MVRGAEGRLYNNVALPGMAQSFGGDEFFHPGLDGWAEGRCHEP